LKFTDFEAKEGVVLKEDLLFRLTSISHQPILHKQFFKGTHGTVTLVSKRNLVVTLQDGYVVNFLEIESVNKYLKRM